MFLCGEWRHTRHAALISVGGAHFPHVITAVLGITLPPSVDGHIVPQPHPPVVLLGSHDLHIGVGQRLPPVGQVAHHPRHREQHREEVRREPQSPVHQSRVEVHVRVQLAGGEELVRPGRLFQSHRHIDQRVAPRNLEYLIRDLPDDFGTRVKVLVHPVAEAEQLLLAVLDAGDEGRNVVHGLDARQHAQHCLVGASVQRPIQRPHPATHRRVNIHPAACQMPYSGR
mmetsp:Transcript_16403/g.49158  ORF Transcript_16403/g.49158 Transcript_16403/m.49158 type:complete len:227 (+) Transcript_16403:910-1590(+)